MMMMMMLADDVQITKQPSSEEWHIAVSPGRLYVCVSFVCMSVCVYINCRIRLAINTRVNDLFRIR